ncbi:hypothetical protein CHARACLAT_005979 [Characodon lateralis]|uniref:HAT C-terminal dimerisation domain-containing protein n=1 Tax=Characodon lateralis TaxID=208331 RepID=A0ABU7E8P3_9TELE|nr:hypothetical protein [Characodon lateralis]
MFPDFKTLAEVVLVVSPVSSVAAERRFNLQNNIKTATRSRLSEAKVQNLMIYRLLQQSHNRQLNTHKQVCNSGPCIQEEIVRMCSDHSTFMFQIQSFNFILYL